MARGCPLPCLYSVGQEGEAISTSNGGTQRIRHNLGQVAQINAEALGQPGQRQFRLLVQAQAGSAVLWLEKEQLQELAMAIKRLLALLDKDVESSQTHPATVETGAGPALDFKIGSLSLGHDPEREMILMTAHDEAAHEEDPATVGCWATFQQMDALADEGLKVCTAGRPRCFLCGTPLNPGESHVCPRANGHIRMS